MRFASSLKEHRAIALSAIVVFCAKATYLLWTSMRGLAMTPWIIDDSYINMRVARNVALGKGFSFDGIHPTNGAPFLWTYITSLNHFLFPFDWAVKMTFVESAFFAMAATLAVYAIAWTVTQSRRTATVAFVLATFTGNAFMEAMNGMDTALFTLLVLLSVGALLGVGMSGVRSSFDRGAIVGLLVGLCILVRGDGLFVAMAIGCCMLADCRRKPSERSQTRRYIVGFASAAAACLLVLVIWGMVRVGSPFPANQVGRRAIALGWHDATHGISFLKYLKVVGWNVFQMEKLITIATGASLLMLVAFLYGMRLPASKKLSEVTLAYCVLFLGMLIGYQWYFPDFHGLRYINPAVHLLLIFVAIFFVELFKGKRGLLFVSFATLAVVTLSGYAFYGELNILPWIKSTTYTGYASPDLSAKYWQFYDWVKAKLPAGTVVGVRDNGQFALFTDLPVQDLSGVIDPTVSQKVNEGGDALAEYLRSRNVSYLWIPSLDQRGDTLYKELHGSLHLELVTDAPPSVYEEHFYRILWN